MIVGSFALLVAAVGTYHAHRVSKEALSVSRKALEIEEARRRDELAPDFELEYTEDEQISFVNRGAMNLDMVMFELGEQEHQPILGIDWMGGGEPDSKGWFGSLDRGEARLYRATRASDEGGTVRLILLCAYGDYRQVATVLVACEVSDRRPGPSADA